MEKKVPERKVSLRENDLFYVYDKRINKCIKADCDGTVKYGLIYKVNVVDEENMNCFECNKCHMKYTPYPNYVRISKPELLTIMNQEEVTARDNKRAEDAAKQAAKQAAAEKRKTGGKFGDRKPYGDKKSYGEKRTFGDKKPYGDRKPYEKKPYENNSYGERKSYGDRNHYEKKPYDANRRYENRDMLNGEKSFSIEKNFSTERKYVRNDGRKGNIVITTGNASGGYHKRPYQKPSYDRGERPEGSTYSRKPYGSYERKPYNKDYSERKSYDNNGSYEKKSYNRGGYTNKGYN